MSMIEINVSIERRKSPHEEPYMEKYKVPVQKGMSVLNVIDYISENCDTTLSYEASCRRGICSVCMVKINGKVYKSCMELAPEEDIEITNGSKNPVKDLTFSLRKMNK
jgi:succinate dehydrogenase/fumarate reductase-like Fe-S protein